MRTPTILSKSDRLFKIGSFILIYDDDSFITTIFLLEKICENIWSCLISDVYGQRVAYLGDNYLSRLCNTDKIEIFYHD
jgi:hypothetical protein